VVLDADRFPLAAVELARRHDLDPGTKPETLVQLGLG
jgi:hypothetical protein